LLCNNQLLLQELENRDLKQLLSKELPQISDETEQPEPLVNSFSVRLNTTPTVVGESSTFGANLFKDLFATEDKSPTEKKVVETKEINQVPAAVSFSDMQKHCFTKAKERLATFEEVVEVFDQEVSHSASSVLLLNFPMLEKATLV